MMLAVTFLVLGFILLIYSASRFVEGSAVVARYLGMPPLLIGMVVVGFGTSSPELVVSVTAAASGNSSLALGNAFGSNIANIALIIGLVALINPIIITSEVIKKGENDIALGNIIGSNLFNTLAVIGLAALVQPMEITPEVISRDWTLMMALTLSLLILGIGIKKQGRINRFEGALLLITFFIYTTYLYYASF